MYSQELKRTHSNTSHSLTVQGADGPIELQYELVAAIMYGSQHYYAIVRNVAHEWLSFDGLRANGTGQPAHPPRGADERGFYPVCIAYAKVM